MYVLPNPGIPAIRDNHLLRVFGLQWTAELQLGMIPEIMETFLNIKTQDGVCEAFIAYPGENGPYPAVLLYMDAFGPRPHLYEMAKMIASRGYYVLIPNLFYRTRKVPVVDLKFPVRGEDWPEAVKQIMPLIQGCSPEHVMKDTLVFLDFLAQQKLVSKVPIGMTGYCMGGRLAILASAHYPQRIAAVASFHAGNLVTDKDDSPHLLLNRIKAELYIGHADNDPSMSPDQIERLKLALERSGIKYQVELYSGAMHGFTMADLPAYNEVAFKRHWEKLFKLFEHTL